MLLEDSFDFLTSSSGDIIEPYGEKDSIVKGRAIMFGVLMGAKNSVPLPCFLYSFGIR